MSFKMWFSEVCQVSAQMISKRLTIKLGKGDDEFGDELELGFLMKHIIWSR